METKTRCLKVEHEYALLIAEGLKTWELRRRPTNIRERIAIADTTLKRIVCFAKIVNCQELTLAELMQHNDKHLAKDFIGQYAGDRKTLYAWVLADVLKMPALNLKYSYSTGSWCYVLP
jgi:hypothetical protein